MESIIGNSSVEQGMTQLVEYVKKPTFWISLLIVVVAVVLWQVLKHVRKKFKEKNGGFSTASHVAFDIARFLFIFLLIIVLLQINGINVTALITGLGVVSVIIGLALQDFLKDIIMGVHILTDKFFQVGDVVRYNGVEGQVISFNVRTTKLKLVSYGEIVTISNRNISEITVLSDMFDFDVDLPYFVDAKLIHDTLKGFVPKIEAIHNVTKCIYKGTERFNESSITYRIRYWTFPGASRFDVKRAITTLVQDGLNEAGIPFPYNHLDVELVGSNQP